MLWIYAGLILIGFMPLMIVIFKISKVKKMKRLGVKTTGIVKDVPMGTLRGLNRVMIEYEVKESGIIISKEITVAGLPYKEGDILPVYYDKSNPDDMLLDSGSGFIFLLIFTILIAAFVIAACYMIYSGIQSGEI